MADKKNEKPIIQTTAEETNDDLLDDLLDVYDEEINNNNSQEVSNMNNNNQTQENQIQQNNAPAENKKKVTVKDVLKIGGAFAIGFAAGATAMHFYDKNNDCSPAENAFI